MYKVAFTGHRPDKLGGYELTGSIAIQLRSLVRIEISRVLAKHPDALFLSGMALGFDTIAAEEVLDLGGTLKACVPFKGQERRWPQESQNHYRELLNKAAEVVFVTDSTLYSPQLMHKRNRFMADRANEIIAAWNGSLGGTGGMIKLCEARGLPITNLWDHLIV